MGKNKRTFIDRKKAVTFHLVHRSQHDPLVTDETAPQHVLVEAKTKEDKEKRREEQKKFGILYDDDYNYLQHLKQPGKDVVWEYVEVPNQKKDVDKKPKLQLPSSVFATEYEEDEGMLNKAAPRPGPRPDWDPDIVAALDEDFDHDNPANELEDNFLDMAMGGEDDDDDFDEDEEYDEEQDFNSDGPLSSDEEDDDEIEDRLAPLMREKRFNDEETKSRFTEYSMSSSILRRNEHLTLLDDRFEKFYATYDEPEVGALDMEEIEGQIDQNDYIMRKCYREFKKSDKIMKYDKSWDKERIKKYEDMGTSDEELVEIEVEDDKQKKWDCESILSTYSNIYNHPTMIAEPKKQKKIEINEKTGMPVNILRGDNNGDKLTMKSLAKFDTENGPAGSSTGPKSLCAKSVLSTLSVLSIRPDDETPEEKHERKRLLKEYRSERRKEKKANVLAFKDEKKRQQKIKLNNQVNIQGNRIL